MPSTSPQVAPQREFLDSRELAEWFGVHPQWPLEARLRGDGPPYVKLGRSVRYRRAAVEAWLARQVRFSTSDRSDLQPQSTP
jgi:predicted DNA-binding transcriptional regulator AlpA